MPRLRYPVGQPFWAMGFATAAIVVYFYEKVRDTGMGAGGARRRGLITRPLHFGRWNVLKRVATQVPVMAKWQEGTSSAFSSA